MTEPTREPQAAHGGPHDHVRPEMRELLAIGGKERVEACWDRIWIHTEKTREAFTMLQVCMNAHPSSKPDGGVISGVSDTEKTFTMLKFCEMHRPRLVEGEECAEYPAIYFATPDKLNRAGFYKKILTQLDFPLAYNANEVDLRIFTVDRTRACKVGVVMLDELHDVGREHGAAVVDYLRFMKGLVNETGRPFVAGGEPVVKDLLKVERQLAGRLEHVVEMEPMALPEFARFVVAYERMLPLRSPSNIRSDTALVHLLWDASEGYVGRLSRLLKRACRAAIESRQEHLPPDLVTNVAGRGLRAPARGR